MTVVKKTKDKKVNFEFNKEYIKVVTDKIASNDAVFITNSSDSSSISISGVTPTSEIDLPDGR